MVDPKKRGVFSSLSSRFKKENKNNEFLVKPPYNDDISLFPKLCPDCIEKHCVAVCEEEIIKIDDAGIPYILYKNGGCTFCEDCANACPSEVLSVKENSESKLQTIFSINTQSCLAWNDVICSSCRDSCGESAIDFFGLFRPTVNMDLCTGCGFCYNVCPNYSVNFQVRK